MNFLKSLFSSLKMFWLVFKLEKLLDFKSRIKIATGFSKLNFVAKMAEYKLNKPA
jgi:hypothetical protein